MSKAGKNTTVHAGRNGEVVILKSINAMVALMKRLFVVAHKRDNVVFLVSLLMLSNTI